MKKGMEDKIDLGFAVDAASLTKLTNSLQAVVGFLEDIADSSKGLDKVTNNFKGMGKSVDSATTGIISLSSATKGWSTDTDRGMDKMISSFSGIGGKVEDTRSKFELMGKSSKVSLMTAEKGLRMLTKPFQASAKMAGAMWKGFKMGKEATARAMAGVRDSIDSLKGVIQKPLDWLGSLKNKLLMLGGAYLGIEGIKASFESAWNAGKELETMTVKMTNQFGSSAFAKKATGFINDMNQEYGLGKDELGSYVEELGKAGIGLEKMNFKGVLNAALGPGKDLQSTMGAITSMAKNESDFQAFNEAFGNQIDVNQFQAAISGASTYQERMTKISDFLGGQFAGNADRFKDSAEGQITSIQGFVEKIQQTIAQSGVFDEMKKILTGFSKFIDSNKDKILGFAKMIGSMMGTVVNFLGGLIGQAFGGLSKGTGIFDTIVKKIKDIFYPMVFFLGFIGAKIGKIIGNLFSGKGSGLAGAVDLVGDLTATIINMLSKALGWIGDMLGKAFDWFNAQLPKLIPAVVGAVGKIIDAIVGFARTLGEKVSMLWPKMLETLKGLGKMIPPVLGKILIGIIDIVKDWAPRVLKILWETLKWAASVLQDLGPELGKYIAMAIDYLGEWISGLFDDLYKMLATSNNPFLKGLSYLVLGAKLYWDSFISIISGAVKVVGNIIGKIGDFFSSIFSGDFLGAGDSIGGIMSV